jgi:hypothetical protein
LVGWRIDSRKLFHYATEEILCLAQRGDVLIEGWEAATLSPPDIPGIIGVGCACPVESARPSWRSEREPGRRMPCGADRARCCCLPRAPCALFFSIIWRDCVPSAPPGGSL